MKRKKVNQLLAMALATSMSVSMVPATAYAASEQTGENVGVVQEEQKTEPQAEQTDTTQEVQQESQSNSGIATYSSEKESNAVTPEAENDEKETLSGNCGVEGKEDSVKWALTENEDDSSTYTLTISGTGKMKENIGHIGDYSSTAGDWKEYNDQITKIVVEDGVTSIGNYAFGNMKKVQSLKLGKDVASYGNWAFHLMSGLENIEVSAENETFKVGEDGVLYSKDGKILYLYPQGKMPENFEYSIPSGVTEIWKGAFKGAEKLTAINLDSEVQKIGDQAFVATGITDVEVPATVTEMGTMVFATCENLKTAVYNANTMLSAQMFNGCSNLEEVTIGKDVTSSGNRPCMECKSLKKVFLNANLSTIAEPVFFNCTSSDVKLYIGEEVTALPNKFAQNFEGLTSVVVEEGADLVTIGENAFVNNTALTEIKDESNRLAVIGANAFKGTGLSGELVLGNQVQSIGSAAFQNTKLTKVVVLGNNNETEILSVNDINGAFGGLTDLTSAKLNNIKSIGRGTFNGCSHLVAVDLTESPELQTIEWRYALKNMAAGSAVYVNSAENAQLFETKDNSVYTKDNTFIAVTNGGVLADDTEYEAGTFAQPTKEGFEFTGWYENADFTGDAATTPVAGKTYYAKWLKENVTLTATSRSTTNENTVANVTLTDANGEAVAEIKRGEEVTATAKTAPGYEFVGWYKDAYVDGQEPVSENLVYKFTADDDMNLVAVYKESSKVTLTVIGTSVKVSVDGGQSTTPMKEYTEQVKVGSTVTVTTEDNGFVNWCNASNKIISTATEYTFVVTGNMTVYEKSSSDAETGTAYVEFVSDYNQIITYRKYSSNETINFPDVPSKPGYEAQGWNMTDEQIKEAMTEQTHIVVKPVYTAKTDTKQFKVFVNGTEGLSKVVTIGSTISVTAPEEAGGKTFAYWASDKAGKEVLGYNNEYFTIVNANTEIYAIYTDSAVTATPVIAMTNITAVVDSNKCKLAFVATRSVPEGYTLLEQGMLYGISANKGDYVLDNESITKKTSSNLSVNGVLTVYVGVKNSSRDKTIYARGYMIVKNETTGNQEVIYTDVASTTFNSLYK